MSLDDAAKRSGIERFALNRLESSKNLNPTIFSAFRRLQCMSWVTRRQQACVNKYLGGVGPQSFWIKLAPSFDQFLDELQA